MSTYLQQDDKKLSADEAMRSPIMAAGPDLTGDPNVIRVFPSNADFSKWADRTAYGEKVREVLRLVRDKVLPERGNEAWVEKVQRLALEQAMGNFGAFAKLVGKDPRDEEVIRLSMVDRTPLTPRIFDPALLYDRRIETSPPQGAPQDPRTSMMVVPTGFWPDLGWVGWNDRASSGRFFSVNVLCENTWFGGRWAWLIGWNFLLNLGNVGFDRKTSSVIAF